MLIKKLEIKNFKSFKQQEIDDLSNINMVYGYNNSGKSNLLKFIELIFRRKQSQGQITVSDTEETFTEETYSGWWEGMIVDEPYIFRNGDRSKNIEFTVVVAATKEHVKEVVTPYKDFKDTYFNDEVVGEAQKEVDKLQEEVQKAEEAGRNSDLEELRKDAGKASDKLKAISEANKDDGEYIEFEFSGRIVARGSYEAEMILDSAKVFDQFIYQSEGSTDKYFEEVDDESELKEEPFKLFTNLLSLFDDAVLFLDNDRYFISENEDKNIDDPNPKTFKNWLYNLYLDPYSFQEYNDILHAIKQFDPTSGGDATIRDMEKNSPLMSLNLNFGRTKDNELLLLLGNEVGSGNRLPLGNYGTGIQQILYILARIAQYKPKVILLEELELNLSPKYQEQLVQHILLNLIENGKKVNQLFFTTHSPLLSIHHHYVIHQVTIDSNGESSFNKVDKEKISDFYPNKVIQELINQHGGH